MGMFEGVRHEYYCSAFCLRIGWAFCFVIEADHMYASFTNMPIIAHRYAEPLAQDRPSSESEREVGASG